MEISNIHLGQNVRVDTTSTVNNVTLGDNVKIAKFCSVYGSPDHLLEIGDHSYVGMFSILNGYSAKLKIGKHVSIAQNVNIMTDSGPNASPLMQSIYPITKGEVIIEDHAWIGAGVIIMPNVRIGRCCIIAANSFLLSDAEPYSVYAGNPAKLIKKINIDDPDGSKTI
jgi:acetyltransferase-like isoleucine patch superfamily enzyme